MEMEEVVDVNDVTTPTIIDEGSEAHLAVPPVKKNSRRFLLPHQRSLSTSRLEEYNNSARNRIDRPSLSQQQSSHKRSIMQNYTKQERGWNTYLAVYVKRMGQRAGGYKWMHSQASVYYNRCYQWVGVSCIIVNTIATAGEFPYVITCQTDLNWIKWTAIVLSVIVTIALTFQQFKSFGGRSSDHSHSEANYSALYDQIKVQLHRNSRERQDANDYVDWIAKEFISLKEGSPVIPEWIWKKYRAKIAGKNIADPEGIDEIVIKKDSPERAQVARDRSENELIEVVIEETHPRFGFLTQAEEDSHQQTEQEKIAMERWNDQ
jgi:hypothetical protein